VLGPFADAPGASSEMAREVPHCAVVDINLGYGPTFEIAEELKQKGVPFLFLTGYDAPTIPRHLAHVERVEKPTQSNRVIEAIARLTAK